MYKEIGKSTRRRSKSSKIRRLGETTDKPNKNSFTKKIWRTLKLLTVTLTLALVVFACFVNGTPLMQFLNSYRQQYNQIIYDSCKPQIDTQELLLKMSAQQIVHQNDALQSLENILSNDSSLTSIAFVGKPGVGKTLVAKAFAENFPWQTNVLYYHWNTHVDAAVQKFQMLRYFLNRMADCGRNLLIIDNLAPCDLEIVSIAQHMNEKLQRERRSSKFFPQNNDKYLIMLFIFSLDTMEYNDDKLEAQIDTLQQLPNTTTINFADFNKTQLKDCILREAALENITLSTETVQQVLSAINPHINGCKNVRAKVLMYAKDNE